MDWILLSFLVIFFLRGFSKGVVNILITFLSSFLIIFVAYKFCEPFGRVMTDANFLNFEPTISNILEKFFPGQTFSSQEEFFDAFSTSGFPFGFFILKLVSTISFEGELTAGQILSPTINFLIFKIIAFLIIFVFGIILVEIIKKILKKLIKNGRFFSFNRIFGAILGIFEGFLFFGITFVILKNFANLFFSESLTAFCETGAVTQFLYKTILIKFLF